MTTTFDTRVSKTATRTRVLVTDLQAGDKVQGRGEVESVTRTTGSRVTVYWLEGGFTAYPVRIMGTFVTVVGA